MKKYSVIVDMDEILFKRRLAYLINSILFDLERIDEHEYQQILKSVKTWEARYCIAELKDIADKNIY